MKKLRAAIGKPLNYVSRDLGCIEWFLMQDDVEITRKEAEILSVITKLYEQQSYMHANNAHRVTDHIEAERKYSLAKRKSGLGLVHTKPEDTAKPSVMAAVIAMNVDRHTHLLIRWFSGLCLATLFMRLADERLINNCGV